MGRHPDTPVDRITGFGNGVRVGHPESVREDARVRDGVAQAVADGHQRRGDA